MSELSYRERYAENYPIDLNNSQKPFTFLSLPPELRLIVYGFLPTIIQRRFNEHWLYISPHRLSFVNRSISSSFLRVCKLIRAKALLVYQEKHKEIVSAPPQVIIDSCKDDYLFRGGPFKCLYHHLRDCAKQHGKFPEARPDGDTDAIKHITAKWIRYLDYKQSLTQKADKVDKGASTAPVIEIALFCDNKNADLCGQVFDLGAKLCWKNPRMTLVIRIIRHIYPTQTTESFARLVSALDQGYHSHDHLHEAKAELTKVIMGKPIELDEYETEWASNKCYANFGNKCFDERTEKGLIYHWCDWRRAFRSSEEWTQQEMWLPLPIGG